MGQQYYWHDWHMYGPWGWGMMFFMVIFWVLVIAGAIYLFRRLPFRPMEKQEDSALEILKKRYARGEISKEEFEEKKRDLI